jgi:hypothetical protein
MDGGFRTEACGTSDCCLGIMSVYCSHVRDASCNNLFMGHILSSCHGYIWDDAFGDLALPLGSFCASNEKSGEVPRLSIFDKTAGSVIFLSLS